MLLNHQDEGSVLAEAYGSKLRADVPGTNLFARSHVVDIEIAILSGDVQQGAVGAERDVRRPGRHQRRDIIDSGSHGSVPKKGKPANPDGFPPPAFSIGAPGPVQYDSMPKSLDLMSE
ncbi:MAG TPA: hypothetical protein VN231_02260 [Allosphingosinicella sp.]|nr:hypothetical protein [Allosphingosinicella sp.]